MKYITMAALALLTAACSNDDNELIPEQAAEAPGITITAQLAPKTGGGETRALSDAEDNKIKATWAKNEHLAILYTVGTEKKVADAEITDVDDATGVATITFTVDDNTVNDTECTLVYPLDAAKADHSGVKDYKDMLATQNGGLSIGLDVRVGAGTIQTVTPGLTVTTQPAAQYSIFKFTLKDITGTDDMVASQFTVSNASNVVITTVTPVPATNTFYVALPALAVGTYWFNATIDNKPYIARGTVSTATVAGKFYQTQVNMATIGDVILTNGKFAAPSTESGKAAMIAYIGADADGSDATNPDKWHGLAIALADESNSYCAWSNNTSELAGVSTSSKMTDHKAFLSGIADTQTLITKYGETYAAAKAAAYSVAGFTPSDYGYSEWFLPSSGQWLKFFEAAGVNVYSWEDWGWAPAPSGGVKADNWPKINTLLTAAGGPVAENWYWSSSECGEGRAARVHFSSEYGVGLNHTSKSYVSLYVRSFLAF